MGELEGRIVCEAVWEKQKRGREGERKSERVPWSKCDASFKHLLCLQQLNEHITSSAAP